MTAMPKKGAKPAAGEKAAKTQPVHRRQFEMEVRVGLHPDDREPIVKDVTNARKEVLILKAEAADTAATYRQKIKETEALMDEGMLLLSQGRPTKRLVEEIRNFKASDKCPIGTLTIKDVETGKIYEQRPMNDADAQIPISDLPNAQEDPPADPADGPDTGDDKG